MKSILLNNSANKILSFLTLNADTSFYDKEISEKTGLSRGMTNRLLNQFLKAGLVSRERRGRMWFYSLNQNPLFKYYRIFENLVELTELVNILKPVSQRIILYGSAASGTDTAGSDIDLFILAENTERAQKVIQSFKGEREIKPVIQTSLEYATSRNRDKGFYDQVDKGIILFNRKIDEQRL